MNSAIIGTGSFIPSKVATNKGFENHNFYDDSGVLFESENTSVIRKFKAITGIEERRYIKDELVTSEIATFAAQNAIDDASIDKETLDYIIVAHNYGDIKHGTQQSDTVPSLASRVKHLLRIKNPNCVAYDVLSGCPGWIQGVIQSHAYIKSEMAKRCLVIGAEALSRVVDQHDRDSMIYSDGAGAVVIEATDVSKNNGIISHCSVTYSYEEAHYIYFGKSNNQKVINSRKYIKMYGRKIYEFALSNVPKAIKDCLDKANTPISDIKKIFIHQANEKMDEAIIKRLYKLFECEIPRFIMPMTINKLGNSSVATVPTVFDLVKKGKLDNHSVNKGDTVVFASVGAGMNINAIVYRL